VADPLISKAAAEGAVEAVALEAVEVEVAAAAAAVGGGCPRV